MYSIWADDLCIHNDAYLDKGYKVLNPKLTFEDNSAGSLTMTIPPGNVGYEKAKRLSSIITVKENDQFLWEGRIIEEQTDFWNNRKVTCEGELGYLNDTTQPPAEYHDYTVRQFLQALIDEHNRKVEAEKRFVLGAITVHDSNDSIFRYTNSESTWRCIEEKLIDRLKGHVRTRHVNGVRTLDYLEDYPNTNTQEVRFGVNLLDFSKNFDMTKLATVIMPRGARLEESPIEALEAYTTVESVNGGSIYVTSESAIRTYGWIEQVVDWDDVTVPANLLSKAKKYLEDVQFEDLVLELTAFDLHHLDIDTESIHILDLVRCVSEPHGMDRFFPVSKVELYLDNPAGSSYTFGDNIKVNLTSNNKKVQNSLIKRIDELPSKSNILKAAKENAEAIINMATNGFITITKSDKGAEELYISDTRDYKLANRYWRWNLNGLGYFKKGAGVKVAITMDGAIVADFITVGTMSANRVRTGLLTSVNGNTSWNLDTGVLTMKKGSISLGNGKFSVNDTGYMHSTYGVIGGFTIGSNQLMSSTVILNNDRLIFKTSGGYIGRYGVNHIIGATPYGLTIELDIKGCYVSFGYVEAADSTTYKTALLIASNRSVGGGYASSQIHCQLPINGHGYTAKSFWIDPNTGGTDGGITGTMYFVKVNSMSSDGTVNEWSNGCMMQFKNGALIRATF